MANRLPSSGVGVGGTLGCTAENKLGIALYICTQDVEAGGTRLHKTFLKIKKK